VSLGGVFSPVPEQLEIKVDLSSASRFPNADELYLLGSAPSFPVYGVGAPDLNVETSWGGSLTVGVRDPWFEAEVSGFGNYAGQYVYFAPELNDKGEPRFDVTIRGAYPTWVYSPIPAVFYGAEAMASIAPDYHIGLDFQGALVRGQHAETGDHLVGVPADRARFTLVGRPPDAGAMVEPYVQVSAELVAKQFLVDPSVDIAAPPDGYVLLGASLGAQFDVGRTEMRASIEGHNLTNARYRSYNSLMRYYADEPGVDVRVRWGLTF
jgi:iron complex outermembrane receptor protein